MKKMITILAVSFLLVITQTATAQCGGGGCGAEKTTCDNAATKTATSTTKNTAAKDETKSTVKIIKVVNTKCPVMGNDVDPKVKTVTYKGKVYGFCCDGCPDLFKKDPEKYLKNMKKTETKTETKAETK